MASSAERLQEALYSLTVRVREIRGLALVDHDGLPLVSTVSSAALEGALSAFGGAIAGQLERAQLDFQLGPVYQLQIVARDRQLYVTPVKADASLVAIVETHATPATVTMHLLALASEARSILELAAAAVPSTGPEDAASSDAAL